MRKILSVLIIIAILIGCYEVPSLIGLDAIVEDDFFILDAVARAALGFTLIVVTCASTFCVGAVLYYFYKLIYDGLGEIRL